MSYSKPQVEIYQEFAQIPAEVADPLRPLILGGHADLHRYAEADEKALIRVGTYDPAEDVCYAWPARAPGSIVDQDYVKVFIDDALLQYYENLIGSGVTVEPVAGYANRIIADSLRFKTSGVYARSTAFNDRDVKINDVVYLRGVYDPDGECEEIEHWTSVAGFAAAEIAGTVAAATWDDDNQETVTADATVEQIAGETNCITVTADGSGYDGLLDGDVEEEYTIEVVRSSVAGCNAARLRVISASGNDDQDEVTPADFGSPTAIGTRGLELTFSNTGTDECSSEASLADVAPTDFVVGQTWRATVRQAFEQVYALADGTYDGPSDDTLIIEVTKGGVWADLPEITVRTARGLDFSGPTVVSDDGTAVSIGTHGVTASFFGSGGGDSDLSIGADAVAGLRKGDKFYINVTAPTAGPVDTLLLRDDLPLRLRSVTDMDLRLYIKDDIELAANRLSDAPNTNWYAETTQICLQEGALAYHSSWTDDGEQLPLPLKDGDVYVQYREWLQDSVNTLIEVTLPSDLDDIPGPLDPDNPYKYGMYYALLASNGTGVRAVAVANPAEVDDWVAALAVVEGDDTFYNFVPMTFDDAVQDLVLAQAKNESGPLTNNWKACFFAALGATSVLRVGSATSSDGEAVLATLADNPAATGTQYTLMHIPGGNGKLITNGVVPGDTVKYLFVSDGFGNETATTFLVDEVLSEDSLVLYTPHTVAINEPEKVEIHHTMTKTEQAVHVAARAASFADMRACVVWPDEFGNSGRQLPGYYLAAYAAGYVGGVAPHRSLTNAEAGGLDDLSKSAGYFNNGQLNKMAEAGVWIFATDKDGRPHIRDGLTTDMSSLNKRKEMYRRNVDAISIFFYNRLKAYIGKANVTPTFLSKLRWEIKDAIGFLKQNSRTDDLGGQLIEGQIITLQQHPLELDHIEVVLELTLPFEVGTIELHLKV